MDNGKVLDRWKQHVVKDLGFLDARTSQNPTSYSSGHINSESYGLVWEVDRLCGISGYLRDSVSISDNLSLVGGSRVSSDLSRFSKDSDVD
jgi:hypothetical protein